MNTTQQIAPVVQLDPHPLRSGGPPPRRLPNLIVLGVALALACSPLAFGYYDFTSWAPLGIGALVLLVMLAFGPSPRAARHGASAAAGLGLLLALSFASILWAESRDSAWTAANQIAVYAVVFAIGLLAIRDHRTARATMLVLGLPALISAVALAGELVSGGGEGAFLQGRLDTPMGYINGTAGLLVMGIWPWLGLAENVESPRLRAVGVGAAAMIAETALLTQSRAIVLATAATITVVLLAAPGRTRRGVNLLIVLVSVALTAHWTLKVYSSTGPAQLLPPSGSATQQAGIAALAAAVLGFALKFAVTSAHARLPADRRARLTTQLGRGLLAVTVAAIITGAVVEHQRISAQWHDFTTMRAEKSADNRFLALGGGYRYDLWRIALDEFTANPVGGVGAGNYADQYYQRRHQLEDVTVPHSLELQMLAELGIGGGIGLALFLGGVLAAGLSRRRTTLAASDVSLRVAAVGMFVAWLAATSVDWLYDIPGLAGMAMLAAAVLVAPSSESAEDTAPPITERLADRAATWPPRPHRGRLGQVALVATLAVLALIGASLGRQYVAVLYSDAGQGMKSAHPLQALRELRTAEQLDPWSLQTQYAVAAAYASLNDYTAARAALLRAQQLEPENYVPPALLGDIATRAGDPATALAAYRRALALDPLEPALQLAVQQAKAGG
jgi:hypothetical protein